MKKAFIVTSFIDADNAHPLTYSAKRTAFTPEERWRQTVGTIASLDQAGDKDTTIFLLELSRNWERYRQAISYQSNLVFVPIWKDLPGVAERASTHPNKSYCEQLLLNRWLHAYSDRISHYEAFVKVSGRYFLDSSFNINHLGDIGFYLKKPVGWEWSDDWNYHKIDRRKIQGNNLFHQYCTSIYGWHASLTSAYLDVSRRIYEWCYEPENVGYDVETMMYYFVQEGKIPVREMPWTIYGWSGVSGAFIRQ